MRTSAFAIVVALTITSAAHADDLVCDAGVLRQSWDLLRMASWGQSEYEHAAFIIGNDAADHEFVIWPFEHQSMRARFHGQIPDRVEAIIHTHPNSKPLPSSDDVRLARTLRLPVYVLTRYAISETDGKNSFFVWVGGWNSVESKRQNSRRCDLSLAR